jgi:outer membrane protein
MTMKTTTQILVAAALAAGALAAVPAQADEGPFMIRVRAVYLDFAQKSDAFSVTPFGSDTAVDIPKDAVTINKKWIPDIDLEYFFTKNFSTELVLTYPQSQDVTVNVPGVGAVGVGSFKHLPPTLTAKWNFLPDGMFRPYVGVGVNLTIISNVNLNVPVGASPINGPLALDLNKTSVGIAGQIGADFKVADHVFINGDVKYVQLGTDVKVPALGGATLTKVHLDPWLLGVGIGYRF